MRVTFSLNFLISAFADLIYSTSMKNLGPVQKTVLGAQFLFVAFGATVLVPLLVGLDPSVALFTALVGVILNLVIPKNVK